MPRQSVNRSVTGAGLIAILAVGLSGCSPATTAEGQAARDHEMSCMAGSVGGALVGAAVGSLFGGGIGRTIMTSAGAGVGATEGQRLACGG